MLDVGVVAARCQGVGSALRGRTGQTIPSTSPLYKELGKQVNLPLFFSWGQNEINSVLPTCYLVSDTISISELFLLG